MAKQGRNNSPEIRALENLPTSKMTQKQMLERFIKIYSPISQQKKYNKTSSQKQNISVTTAWSHNRTENEQNSLQEIHIQEKIPFLSDRSSQASVAENPNFSQRTVSNNRKKFENHPFLKDLEMFKYNFTKVVMKRSEKKTEKKNPRKHVRQKHLSGIQTNETQENIVPRSQSFIVNNAAEHEFLLSKLEEKKKKLQRITNSKNSLSPLMIQKKSIQTKKPYPTQPQEEDYVFDMKNMKARKKSVPEHMTNLEDTKEKVLINKIFDQEFYSTNKELKQDLLSQQKSSAPSINVIQDQKKVQTNQEKLLSKHQIFPVDMKRPKPSRHQTPTLMIREHLIRKKANRLANMSFGNEKELNGVSHTKAILKQNIDGMPKENAPDPLNLNERIIKKLAKGTGTSPSPKQEGILGAEFQLRPIRKKSDAEISQNLMTLYVNQRTSQKVVQNVVQVQDLIDTSFQDFNREYLDHQKYSKKRIQQYRRPSQEKVHTTASENPRAEATTTLTETKETIPDYLKRSSRGYRSKKNFIVKQDSSFTKSPGGKNTNLNRTIY